MVQASIWDPDYGRAFEEFEALFNRLHGPRDMMMIQTELGDGTRDYLSLPDPKLVKRTQDLSRSTRRSCLQKQRCSSAINTRSASSSGSRRAIHLRDT